MSENQTLSLAEEVFTAKLNEVMGDSIIGSAVRPVTLVVCCAPPLVTAIRSAAVESDEDEDAAGGPPNLDATATTVPMSLVYKWNDALNPYRNKDMQALAALHLGVVDEVKEAGQVMSQWHVPGPSREVEVETSSDIRLRDGSTMSKTRWEKRNVCTTVPIALVSEGGYPTTIVINAYVCGLFGNVQDPPAEQSDASELKPTEEGINEASGWVRFVSQQIELITGRAPSTVVYHAGFEESLPFPIPARLKNKAFSELRSQVAGSFSEFCVDEETQMPWLRPMSEEDQQTFVEEMPSRRGLVAAAEPKGPFESVNALRVPGKTLRPKCTADSFLAAARPTKQEEEKEEETAAAAADEEEVAAEAADETEATEETAKEEGDEETTEDKKDDEEEAASTPIEEEEKKEEVDEEATDVAKDDEEEVVNQGSSDEAGAEEATEEKNVEETNEATEETNATEGTAETDKEEEQEVAETEEEKKEEEPVSEDAVVEAENDETEA